MAKNSRYGKDDIEEVRIRDWEEEVVMRKIEAMGLWLEELLSAQFGKTSEQQMFTVIYQLCQETIFPRPRRRMSLAMHDVHVI